MDMHDMRLREAKKGYGNLGDDQHGLQKVANDKARADVLKEFSAEMDSHDSKRLPAGGSPLNGMRLPEHKEEQASEDVFPPDFDERVHKLLRGK